MLDYPLFGGRRWAQKVLLCGDCHLDLWFARQADLARRFQSPEHGRRSHVSQRILLAFHAVH
eukprot:2278997-Amphidinium_carterae.1